MDMAADDGSRTRAPKSRFTGAQESLPLNIRPP